MLQQRAPVRIVRERDRVPHNLHKAGRSAVSGDVRPMLMPMPMPTPTRSRRMHTTSRAFARVMATLNRLPLAIRPAFCARPISEFSRLLRPITVLMKTTCAAHSTRCQPTALWPWASCCHYLFLLALVVVDGPRPDRPQPPRPQQCPQSVDLQAPFVMF
jgi:hypothetical protein